MYLDRIELIGKWLFIDYNMKYITYITTLLVSQIAWPLYKFTSGQ